MIRASLSGPDDVACVAVRYQIAQKLHACTEVFTEPPPNDRFRDLSDLLMLEALIDDLASVRSACVEIFELRGKHSWPPTVTVFEGWPEQYAALAAELDFEPSEVHAAASNVQGLIEAIDRAIDA
ncbi:MAG TPA: nucleotidyl transferase AbiEii/AbiGii toxin family protein [Solirubrobacter sp.]|nr:nucleotidyl transferase AbiEii/AbiGii toxin family protein [Solirubrobacter sp.]